MLKLRQIMGCRPPGGPFRANSKSFAGILGEINLRKLSTMFTSRIFYNISYWDSTTTKNLLGAFWSKLVAKKKPEPGPFKLLLRAWAENLATQKMNLHKRFPHPPLYLPLSPPHESQMTMFSSQTIQSH